MSESEKKRFNVHIYREMRLLFSDIPADSPEDAAAIVRDHQADQAQVVDDCDGRTFGALVDVVGDEEYLQSKLIEWEGDGSVKQANRRGSTTADYSARPESARTQLLEVFEQGIEWASSAGPLNDHDWAELKSKFDAALRDMQPEKVELHKGPVATAMERRGAPKRICSDEPKIDEPQHEMVQE